MGTRGAILATRFGTPTGGPGTLCLLSQLRWRKHHLSFGPYIVLVKYNEGTLKALGDGRENIPR